MCARSCLVLVFLYAPSLSPLAGTQAPSCLTQHLYLEILSWFRAHPQRSAHSYLTLQPPPRAYFYNSFTALCLPRLAFPLTPLWPLACTDRYSLSFVLGVNSVHFWGVGSCPTGCCTSYCGPPAPFSALPQASSVVFEFDCFHLFYGFGAGGADGFAVRSAGSLWAKAGEDRKGRASGPQDCCYSLFPTEWDPWGRWEATGRGGPGHHARPTRDLPAAGRPPSCEGGGDRARARGQ